MAFTVRRSTPLPRAVGVGRSPTCPSTPGTCRSPRCTVPDGGLALGSEVSAVTRLGPVAGADRMLVTAWSPAAGCASSRPGGSCAAGRTSASRTTGAGSARRLDRGDLAAGPAPAHPPVGDRLGPLLFGRVVDGLVAAAESRPG